jgi:hypothetical protein
MRRILLITLLIALFMSNQAFAAATIFFKDGTKEVGTSVWIEGGSVYLDKANEVYEFSPDEVNMDETLRFNRLGSYADKAVPLPEVRPRREPAVNREASPKKEPGNKSAKRGLESLTPDNAASDRPFFGVQMPDDSKTCSNALKAALMARFVKYNQAAEAGDFRAFEMNIMEDQAEGSRKALAGLSKKELNERRKILKSLASKNYRATACIVAPDGQTAALAGRGVHGTGQNSHGSFLFSKEGQTWKVQSSVWNMSM